MPARPSRQTLILTGIAGRFGRLLARSLHETYQVIGIDPRGALHMPSDVTVHALDLRRRKAEDIFRRNRIDAVIHLPLEAGASESVADHRSLSVVGTRKVLSYCQKHDIPKVILLSSAAIYGARHDNHQFLTEESPLLAGAHSRAMRDAVEMDMYATSFFWRHPEVDTVLLRPVHVVGRLQNAASRYLRLRQTPTLMGFDPMVQVISPEDVVHAIRLSLKPGIRGVFNVAGPSAAPLSALIRRLGHRRLPLPEPMLRGLISMLLGTGGRRITSVELDHLKYVCMVDDSRARDVLRYVPQHTLDQTLRPLR